MAEREEIIMSVSVEGIGKAESQIQHFSATANKTIQDLAKAFSGARFNVGDMLGNLNLTGVKRAHTRYAYTPLTKGGSVVAREYDLSRAFQAIFPAIGAGNTGISKFNKLQDQLERAARKRAFFAERAKNALKENVFGAPKNTTNKGAWSFAEPSFENKGNGIVYDLDHPETWLSEEIKRGIISSIAELTPPPVPKGPPVNRYRWKGWSNWFSGLKDASEDGLRNTGKYLSKTGMNKGGVIGGAMSAIGGIASRALPLIGALWLFNKAVMAITKTFKMFHAVAENWFKMFKQSLTGGLSNGRSASELDIQQKLLRMYGGDAASASAFNAKIATARAMLAYGGSGGALMEAARLFGVGFTGIGEYGFATNREFLNNVARRMGSLGSGGKLALANTVGLSPEMFWAMKDGYDMFQKRMDYAQSWHGKLYGDSMLGLNDSESMKITESFTVEWGRFMTVLKEFMKVLGSLVIPILTALTRMLNVIFDSINVLLGPIFKILGIVINKLASNNNILSDPSYAARAAMNSHDAYRNMLDNANNINSNRSVNIQNVNISTNESLSNSNAASFGRGVGDGVLGKINTFTGSGFGKRSA